MRLADLKEPTSYLYAQPKHVVPILNHRTNGGTENVHLGIRIVQDGVYGSTYFSCIVEAYFHSIALMLSSTTPINWCSLHLVPKTNLEYMDVIEDWWFAVERLQDSDRGDITFALQEIHGIGENKTVKEIGRYTAHPHDLRTEGLVGCAPQLMSKTVFKDERFLNTNVVVKLFNTSLKADSATILTDMPPTTTKLLGSQIAGITDAIMEIYETTRGTIDLATQATFIVCTRDIEPTSYVPTLLDNTLHPNGTVRVPIPMGMRNTVTRIKLVAFGYFFKVTQNPILLGNYYSREEYERMATYVEKHAIKFRREVLNIMQDGMFTNELISLRISLLTRVIKEQSNMKLLTDLVFSVAMAKTLAGEKFSGETELQHFTTFL